MDSLKKSEFDPWKGSIALIFQDKQSQTYLTARKHQGPLLVQRPFYPEGSVCHVYLIHPPGGVVGGDQLAIDIDCQHAAQVLLTTPAAGKFYRSSGKTAYQKVNLKLADDAVLEWMPQETILFDGANVCSSTEINLQQNSRVFAWDLIGLGRPVCGESFQQGRASINFAIVLDEKPLFTERILLNADTMNSLSGMAGQLLMANLFVYPAGTDALHQVREIAQNERFFGATLMNNLLVCRMLGMQAEPVRQLFIKIWQALRPGLNQRQACLPRIWVT